MLFSVIGSPGSDGSATVSFWTPASLGVYSISASREPSCAGNCTGAVATTSFLYFSVIVSARSASLRPSMPTFESVNFSFPMLLTISSRLCGTPAMPMSKNCPFSAILPPSAIGKTGTPSVRAILRGSSPAVGTPSVSRITAAVACCPTRATDSLSASPSAVARSSAWNSAGRLRLRRRAAESEEAHLVRVGDLLEDPVRRLAQQEEPGLEPAAAFDGVVDAHALRDVLQDDDLVLLRAVAAEAEHRLHEEQRRRHDHQRPQHREDDERAPRQLRPLGAVEEERQRNRRDGDQRDGPRRPGCP